nr:MAG TPA: hypothetical protein [Caudoviricetes sp.]DAX72955.1 MAG TPA: hypothetical protein [Caudoviricetes sp.]
MWGRKTMKNTTINPHGLKLPPDFSPENGSISYKCITCVRMCEHFIICNFLISPYFVP